MMDNNCDSAYAEIEAFIRFKANQLIQKGWTLYVTKDEKLCTLEALKAYEGLTHINVSSAASDSGICSPEVNYLFRFYHDYLHLTMGEDFSDAGERAVAAQHFDDGIDFGLSYGAMLALKAETIGQLEYYQKHGEHVKNQRAFTTTYIQKGSRYAINFPH